MPSIHQANIPRAILNKYPKIERDFFIMAGHIHNEINVLNKILFWSSKDESEDPILIRAKVVQMLTIGKILAGKLNESWDTIRKLYLSSNLKIDYQNLLSKNQEKSLENLKVYFGKKNTINKVRNRFGFHYDSNNINDYLNATPDNEDWSMYLSETKGNSLYFIQDAIINHGLTTSINPENPDKSIDDLIDDIMRVSGELESFLEGYLSAFVEKHLPKQSLIKFDIHLSRTMHEIRIPFFYEEES